MDDFNVSFLVDLYLTEERIKIQSKECEQCQCYTCLIQNEHKNCKERCFKRCKNKKYIWIKCRHYKSI